MTDKVAGPIRFAFSAAEPFFRCFFQSSQDILVNLPVPGQDLLRRAIVPACVNEMVPLGDIEAAFFNGYGLSPGGTSDISLPMGNVSECIFDRPGVFGFRALYQSIPLFVCKVGNELIEKLKFLDRTLDNFLTGVNHARKTSCTLLEHTGRPSAVEYRPAEFVPQALIVQDKLANRLRQLVALPAALEPAI